MSARDDLMRLKPWDWTKEDLAARIDAFAHELAEKQRHRARRIAETSAGLTGRAAEDAATRRRAWDAAADLIDPERPS